MDIQQQLKALSDPAYREFQSKLMPTVPKERIWGVRMPLIRKLAKDIFGSPEAESFMEQLPHSYYDEDMLHGALLCLYKDYEATVMALNRFLPYVDNWAVCDTMRPKAFNKCPPGFYEQCLRWMESKEVYTCRFGMEMLMSFFLKERFRPQLPYLVAKVKSEAYYVQMMQAWFLATALAFQWDEVLPVLEQRLLTPFVHNKTLQKARESYRISSEQKAHLQSLKIPL